MGFGGSTTRWQQQHSPAVVSLPQGIFPLLVCLGVSKLG